MSLNFAFVETLPAGEASRDRCPASRDVGAPLYAVGCGTFVGMWHKRQRSLGWMWDMHGFAAQARAVLVSVG